MIRVYIASGPADAELFHGYLQENGIEAAVEGDELWTARSLIPLDQAAMPSVWVNEPDAEKARALIREYEHPSKTDHPKWQCAHCGEKLAGQFSHCWHCGTPRDTQA